MHYIYTDFSDKQHVFSWSDAELCAYAYILRTLSGRLRLNPTDAKNMEHFALYIESKIDFMTPYDVESVIKTLSDGGFLND